MQITPMAYEHTTCLLLYPAVGVIYFEVPARKGGIPLSKSRRDLVDD